LQFPTPFCVQGATAPFPRGNRPASYFSVCVSAATPPAAVHAYTVSVVPLLRAASTVLTQWSLGAHHTVPSPRRHDQALLRQGTHDADSRRARAVKQRLSPFGVGVGVRGVTDNARDWRLRLPLYRRSRPKRLPPPPPQALRVPNRQLASCVSPKARRVRPCPEPPCLGLVDGQGTVIAPYSLYLLRPYTLTRCMSGRAACTQTCQS
jgi:hypothetical protein